MTAIVVKQHSEWRRNRAGTLVNTTRPEYEIVKITSVSRDGWINRYRDAWGSEVTFTKVRKAYAATSILVPDVDADEALAVASAHYWPGHPHQPKSYDALEDVRLALAPLHRQEETP